MHFVRRFGIVESMKKKILDFIELHHMLEGNDRVIAGISGGADSVYLLFVLRELREKMGFDLDRGSCQSWDPRGDGFAR